MPGSAILLATTPFIGEYILVEFRSTIAASNCACDFFRPAINSFFKEIIFDFSVDNTSSLFFIELVFAIAESKLCEVDLTLVIASSNLAFEIDFFHIIFPFYLNFDLLILIH